jgi:alpha-mannosidase
MSNKDTVHVISGTHWDREWRFTAEQSLLRLAELVDELLDIWKPTVITNASCSMAVRL